MTDPAFLRYQGKRPISNGGDGLLKQPQGTVDGCGVMTSMLSTGMSFGIHHLGYNTTHDVVLQDCHVFDKSLLQFEDLGQMGQTEDFDFFDPLTVEPDIIADNRGMKQNKWSQRTDTDLRCETQW